MSGSYGPLAGCYDQLTYDVDYPRWADYIEKHFARRHIPAGRCWTWPAAPAPSPGSWPGGGMR